MGRTCVVPGCSKKNLQGNTVSFHRFPLRHPEKLQLWLDAIGLVNHNLAKHHRICSEHFKSTDFYSINSNKKKIMKEEAIPTLNLNCSQKKTKMQSKYKGSRSKSGSKPTPSTSSTQSETKYSNNFPYTDMADDQEDSNSYYQDTPMDNDFLDNDKTLTDFQKERLRRQMHQDMLLFEQQMKILRHETEAKALEKDRKSQEYELRMQLLHTQLEKAQMDLEEAKIRMYRFRNPGVTHIKNELIDEQETPVPELSIIQNDIQMVPLTNGINSGEIDSPDDDSSK